MIERPQPPSPPKAEQEDMSIAALRQEIKRMSHDITFLKSLLEHLRGEFARLKK